MSGNVGLVVWGKTPVGSVPGPIGKGPGGPSPPGPSPEAMGGRLIQPFFRYTAMRNGGDTV
jgi:hypothetical protein